MKANGRTLLMVLQTAALPKNRPQVEADLFTCYDNMARYTGGGAVRATVGDRTPTAPGTPGGGVPGTGPGGGLVQPIVNVVQKALGRLQAKVDRAVYRPRATARLSVTFKNPNAYTVRLATLRIGLPKGAFLYVKGSSAGATRKNPRRAGRVLTWNVGKGVRAGASLTLRFRVVLPAKAGRYSLTSTATARLPNGATITSSLAKPTRIVVRGR